jgi:hypothetical protein
VDLLAEESERNPEFASELDSVLSALPEQQPSKARSRPRKTEPFPDVYAEWNTRGESEFRLWLRDQPIPMIRTVIRTHDLDPKRRTVKWKDPEKLADFAAEGLKARLSRGSAFIGTTKTGRVAE